MNNYIFVSNESLESITSFYINHLNNKKEKFSIFNKQSNKEIIYKKPLINKGYERIIFLLNPSLLKSNKKEILDIYNYIEYLSKLNIKSTIITSKIDDDILHQLSKRNAMILMSEEAKIYQY